MRSGEAVDAIRNFVATGTSEQPLDSATFLLCGVMQLGGILYLALLIPFVLILAMFVPCAATCGLIVFQVCCCITVRRPKAAAAAPAAAKPNAKARVKAKATGSSRERKSRFRVPGLSDRSSRYARVSDEAPDVEVLASVARSSGGGPSASGIPEAQELKVAPESVWAASQVVQGLNVEAEEREQREQPEAAPVQRGLRFLPRGRANYAPVEAEVE